MSFGKKTRFSWLTRATLVMGPLLLASSPAFAQAPRQHVVEKILDNGPDAKRVNVIIMGDGYRESEQELLTQRATDFIERFVKKSPFVEHDHWVNAHVVHVISNESGADNGAAGGLRDTALGANFNCNGIDRLLCIDDALVAAVLQESVEYAQIVLISVNDTKYGGAGGTYGTFSAADSAPDIALHEFAHAYGGLADEYDDAYPGYPDCSGECPEANASLFYSREQNKWAHWIDTGTTLPTTGNDPTLVGAYEGSRYKKTGVYRPVPQCQMRALGNEFCPVCAEEIALRIHAQVNPIDERSPAGDTVDSEGCPSLPFSITRVPSATAKVTWRFDGSEVGGNADTLDLDLKDASPGEHTLEVEVKDETPLIRKDPDGVTLVKAQWSVNVTTGECDQDTGESSSDSSDETSGTGNPSDTEEASSSEDPQNSSTENSKDESGSNSSTSSHTTDTTPDDGTSQNDGSTDPQNDDGTQTVTCSCKAQADAGDHLLWLGAIAGLACVRRRRPRVA